MRVIWLKTAEKHLEEIYSYLAQENAKAAADIYNTIIEQTDRLALFPKMGALELLLRNEKYYIVR